MRFELYLDESGDFEKDNQNRKYFNPSLVGGLLIESGKVSDNVISRIIKNATGKNNVHCKDEQGETVIKILKEIEKWPFEVIIFENIEKLKIIDSTTTYLNILAEGITQLISHLSAKYGRVELKIVVAKRLDVVNGNQDINLEEYIKLLREKIIVGLARNELSSTVMPKFTFELGDARYHQHLMLADAVCNGYLTRKAKQKFTEEQRQYLKELFLTARITSLVPGMVKRIENLLIHNRISDAVFTLLFEHAQGNKEVEEVLKNLIIPKLSLMKSEEIDAQLYKVSLELGHIVKIQKEYHIAKKVGKVAQEMFIPILNAEQISYSNIFNLDIILYLYTIYTHEGSIEAEKQDELFNKEIIKIQDLIVRLNYFIMYQNRRAVHLLNFFQYEMAIETLTLLIQACNDLIQLMDLIEGLGLQSIEKFNQLGKLYGTRGQAYMRLISKDPSYLDLAIADFNLAIDHFEKFNDVERQYVYKATAYAQAREIKQSLTCLLKCEQLDELTIQNIILACNKWSENIKSSLFKINCFTKLITLSNDNEFAANILVSTLNKSKLDIIKVIKETGKDRIYPLPLICWNMAKYYRTVGNRNKVQEYIERACESLEKAEQNAYLLQIMRIALLTWYNNYLKEENRLTSTKNNEYQLKVQQVYLLLKEKDQQYLLEKLNYENILKDKPNSELLEKFINKVEMI